MFLNFMTSLKNFFYILYYFIIVICDHAIMYIFKNCLKIIKLKKD